MHKMLVEVSKVLILHGKKCKTDATINTCVPWITKTEGVCVHAWRLRQGSVSHSISWNIKWRPLI